MRQAKSVGAVHLSRTVKLHQNWKYPFLRPTIEEIIQRYQTKFGGGDMAQAFSILQRPLLQRLLQRLLQPERLLQLLHNGSCNGTPVMVLSLNLHRL